MDARGADDSAEEAYEHSPCGLLSTRPDGSIVRINETFLTWTGYERSGLLAGGRLQDLMSHAGRVFYETHLVPLLRMHGLAKEIACDLRRADGSALPILLNAVQVRDAAGQPALHRFTIFDATQRRRYEAELLLARQRAERYAVIIDASFDAIVSVGADGTVQTWNTGAERLLGYPAKEAIGRALWTLATPTEPPEEIAAVVATLRAGGIVERETICTARDGRRVDVSISLTPHIAPPGELIGVSAILRDISRRKQAADRIRVSEIRYRRLFEAARDGVLLVDPLTRKITDANPFMTALLGYSHDDLVGKELFEIGLLADEAASQEMFEKLKAEHQVRYDDLPLEGSAGQRREVEVVANLYDEDGQAVIQCNIRDISARKATEQALHDNEQRYRALIDATATIVWRTTPTGEVVFATQAWSDITGQTEEENRGWGWLQAVHPDDRDRTIDRWRRSLVAVTLYENEFRVRTRAGSYRWFAIRGVPILRADGSVREWVGANTDVHDRKQADDALRASEALLRFATAGVGLTHVEVDYVRGSARSAENFAAVMGYAPLPAERADMSARVGHVLAHVVSDDRARVELALKGWLDGTPAGKIEFRVLGDDQIERWIESRWSTEFDDAGQPSKSFATNLDITQRRIAEQQLRESEVRFRDNFEHAAIGMAHVGLDGRWLRVNRALCRILGYSPDDLLAKTFADITYPDDLAADIADVDRTLAGEIATYTTEKRYVRQDGAIVWANLTVALLRDAAEQPTHFIATIQDISTHKRAEEALRESERRFRVMADEAPVMLWQTDRSGTVDFVNHAYMEFFGVSLEERRRSGWQPLVHPEDRARIATVYENMPEGKPFHGEARVRRADGEWRWTSSYGSPRTSPSGEFLGTIATSVDITEQKRAVEVQLQAAREKDEFIATLAHELRNPLAPIRTAVAILRARGAADPLLMRSRDIIDRQVTHMARLLEDLLDTSRLSRGTFTLQRAGVLLSEVIAAAIETSRPIIDERGHDLVVEGADRVIVLDADATRLTQVFANLLNNAAKYSDPGGRIELRIRREGEFAVISVRDRGIGIDADMLARVFDLFAQADAVRGHASGGLGIGLALAHRIVALHGGGIDVTSAGEGQGSEFTVRLPALGDDRREAQHPFGNEAAERMTESVQDTLAVCASAASGPARRRVLIADDNADAADSLAVLLQTIECDVRTVYDGAAAIREAEQFRPDVLILDIGMPELDGHETARRIRRQSWGGAIFLIALTGWGQEEDRRRTAGAGFDRHLVKPVDPDALLALVRMANGLSR